VATATKPFLHHLEHMDLFPVTFKKQKMERLSNFRGCQLFLRDDTTLVYVSIYKSSVEMDPAMWETDYPSPGQDCVHCTYTSCMDDGCGVNMPVQICSYPLGPPITNLQGLCAQSLLGNAYFLKLFLKINFLNCVQQN
jgi:hypothetical protein